jgi:hypothetical protein
LLLKKVADIVVLPLEQAREELARANHGDWVTTKTYSVDPPVFMLEVHETDTGDFPFLLFEFRDEQLANRVAKAMVHAVELCGGGGKSEPF